MSSRASDTNLTPAINSALILPGLPQAPGVYRFVDSSGTVLYVGKAKNLKKRVSSYFRKSGLSPRISLMMQQAANVETTATRSEAEALILENTLIKKLTPRYNILFRDDKSYPYIALSNHAFPRIYFHRGRFAKGVSYFGPFPSGQAVRQSLALLQKTFRLRTCENSVFAHRSRPCLLHQINLCKAPCVKNVTATEYAQDVRLAQLFLRGKSDELITGLSAQMEQASQSLEFETAAHLRDQIRALQAILHRQYVSTPREENVDVIAVHAVEGKVCVNLAMVRGGLHLGDRALFTTVAPAHHVEPAEVLLAFIHQHYLEQPPPAKLIVAAGTATGTLHFPHGALKIKQARTETELSWLSMAEKNAQLAIASQLYQNARRNDRLEALGKALELPSLPTRIDCFDISHTMGEQTVASCVVCVNGAMKKSDYRRFNIKGIEPGDDYAAMRQVLTRRYEKVASGEATAPDLVLIDGGKGQLSVAKEVLGELNLEHIPGVCVAKGESRKPGLETLLPFNCGQKNSLKLQAEHPAFHLIQEIRDEAHRFAIVGHRARRAKTRTHSTLENIPGIGPVRRRKLLTTFGGIAGVRDATVEDLQRIGSISRRLAESVHNLLRK